MQYIVKKNKKDKSSMNKTYLIYDKDNKKEYKIIINSEDDSYTIENKITDVFPSNTNLYLIYYALCEKDGNLLKIVPKKYLDLNICKAAIANSSNALTYVPLNYQSEELYLYALSVQPTSLKSIPKKRRTKYLCMLAFSKSRAAFTYIPEEYRTVEMYVLYIHEVHNDNLEKYLNYIPDDIYLDAYEIFKQYLPKDVDIRNKYIININKKVISLRYKQIKKEKNYYGEYKILDSSNDSLVETIKRQMQIIEKQNLKERKLLEELEEQQKKREKVFEKALLMLDSK